MNDDYPTLASMGIENPLQIASYTVSQSRPDTDMLRIRYVRPKGSFLPVTKRFNIGRTPRTQTIDSGTRQTELWYEISPLLEKAQNELDSIVKGKAAKSASQAEIKQQLLREIGRLEQDFHADIASLKLLLDKLDD